MAEKKKKQTLELHFGVIGKNKGKIVKNEHYKAQEFIGLVLPAIKFEEQIGFDKLYKELIKGTKLKFSARFKPKKVIALMNLFFAFGKHTGYWAARQTVLSNARVMLDNDNKGKKRK